MKKGKGVGGFTLWSSHLKSKLYKELPSFSGILDGMLNNE
jgi:hypothetical protein